MFFYFTDETNIAETEFEFFIYGGLVIQDKYLKDTADVICHIKSSKKIPLEEEIKWKPHKDSYCNKNFGRNEYTKIKARILDFVIKSEAQIIIYLAPLEWFKENTLKSLEYAMNISLQKFDQFLRSGKGTGIIIADDFPKPHKKPLLDYLVKTYTLGTGKLSIDTIHYPVITVSSRYSPIHQINDIVLGSIQYNLRKPKRKDKQFVHMLKNNFWGKKMNNYKIIKDFGVNIYPKKAKIPKIQDLIDKADKTFKRIIESGKP